MTIRGYKGKVLLVDEISTMKITRTNKRNPVYLKHNKNRKLFRIIEGAVVDAMKQHPEYFTDKAGHSCVASITKRVMGAVLSNSDKVPRGTVDPPSSVSTN